MKVIVRAADYGMTDSITDGCLKAIRDGILTDVGLMTNNYDYAKRAVEEIKKYPHVSMGQDLNIVSGKAASDPKDIPTLVDENGNFLSSTYRKIHNLYDIPYDEIYRELKLQIERFIEIVGRKPSYLVGHSLRTDELERATNDLIKEYDIPFFYCRDELKVGDRWYFKNMNVDPNDKKPNYGLKEQDETDVIAHIINGELNFNPNDEYGLIPTHCGYCDGELLNMSTFSVVRGREVEALCSDEVKKWIKENNIELINFDEFRKLLAF